MKKGNCKRCKCYQKCIRTCRIVAAELYRIEHARKKNKIELVFEAELTGPQATYYMAKTYGLYNDPKE